VIKPLKHVPGPPRGIGEFTPGDVISVEHGGTGVQSYPDLANVLGITQAPQIISVIFSENITTRNDYVQIGTVANSLAAYTLPVDCTLIWASASVGRVRGRGPLDIVIGSVQSSILTFEKIDTPEVQINKVIDLDVPAGEIVRIRGGNVVGLRLDVLVVSLFFQVAQ